MKPSIPAWKIVSLSAVAVLATGVAVFGWTALAGALAGGPGRVEAGPPVGRPRPPGPANPAGAPSKPDAALVKNLSYMRQEEQLARDVYLKLANAYPQAPVFANIAASEQWHFDSLGRLLTSYGLPDPTAGRDSGSFEDSNLQRLYDSLVSDGSKSLAKAYEAGKTVETTDIADLEAAIAQTSAPDAKWVFSNLLRGSQNHLAALTAAASGQDPHLGNGGGMGAGRGMGNGSGQNAGRGNGPNR